MTLKTLLLSAIASSALVVCLTSAANTNISVTASVGGAPTGTTLDNLDALPLGSGGGTTATGIVVTFTPAGGAVQGAASGVYAAPFLSGGNGTGFGSPNQPDGADATTYLTAGGTSAPDGSSGSSATLLFPDQLHYVGLLWGSIDTYNTLELFDGSTLVGTVTGSDAAAAASTLPNGNQAAMGTAYVDINSTDPFNTIVALSTQYAFEFDNISYSENATNVPEPLTLSLFGAGLAGAAALRRRRQKKA